jgi:hypothetical protein
LKTLEEEITQLRDQTWIIARESLEAGETNIYKSLTEIAAKLTRLIRTSKKDEADTVISSDMIDVFAYYKGKAYEAKLDLKRIGSGREPCILSEGKWWTPSGSAVHVTNTPINGWLHFWKYKMGNDELPITNLRKVNLKSLKI